MLLAEISCVKMSNLVDKIILQAILIKMFFSSVVNLLAVSMWSLIHMSVYANVMSRCSNDVEIMDQLSFSNLQHWSFSEYFGVTGIRE